MIRCYELSNTISVAEALQWIDDAITERHTLVFLMHEIVPGVLRMYEYNEEDLDAILDYVASRPIDVMTMTDVLQYSSDPNLISNPSFTDVRNDWATSWQRSDPVSVTVDSGSISRR